MTTTDFEGLFVVLTSIQCPTPQVEAFLRQPHSRTIFVADLKTPPFAAPTGLDLISVYDQKRSTDLLVFKLPWGHYARKNIGYLHAIRNGARAIFDSDDDNYPVEPWMPRPAAEAPARAPSAAKQWVNAYAYFGAEQAWPRGYPLTRITCSASLGTISCSSEEVVVWQGLVEGEPDVDAIFRLTHSEPVIFYRSAPIVLPEGSYCPFNSQNTWWNQCAFPYLYLPSTVSFRFTDILRGLIAQRCFWAHGWQLGFHGPTALQQRNPHNLMSDFRDELSCYLHTETVVKLLESLELSANALDNLHLCYTALRREDLTGSEELAILECWLNAISNTK